MEKNTQALAKFAGEEGMESRVVVMSRGFIVILRDTDAEMDFPPMRIFKEQAPAFAYAREIVGLEAA